MSDKDRTEAKAKAKAVVWQAINLFCEEKDSERKANLKAIIDIYLDDLFTAHMDILAIVVDDPSPENIDIAKGYIELVNKKNTQRNNYLDTLVELNAIMDTSKGCEK